MKRDALGLLKEIGTRRCMAGDIIGRMNELLAVAFSTFLGAAVALAADRLARLRDAKLKEEAAINNLIMDLAGKRSFLTGEDWKWGEGEVARVVASIFDARALIRDARLSARPRSPVLPHLRRMTRLCNTFIEAAERLDDEQLKGALRTLSVGMSVEVEGLHALRPKRIVSDPPGSFSLDLTS
jgi:hypothetical protein